MKPKGLFVGITTVDMHYLVEAFPEPNRKMRAQTFGLATGGPATNAAVTFAHLGGQSTLGAGLGQHAFTEFMRQDLRSYGLELLDLTPEDTALPPFSTIITTRDSGERAVVAYALDQDLGPAEALPAVDVGAFDILLLDGFQMAIALALAEQARARGVPVVLDGGSWKAGMESLLRVVDVAICSADFRAPGSKNGSEPREILDYLAGCGVSYAAITRGEKPVVYYAADGYGQIPVEKVRVVDTLGAGDVFHGAFCYHFAQEKDFAGALRQAARTAGRSCAFFGARAWMKRGNS